MRRAGRIPNTIINESIVICFNRRVIRGDLGNAHLLYTWLRAIDADVGLQSGPKTASMVHVSDALHTRVLRGSAFGN